MKQKSVFFILLVFFDIFFIFNNAHAQSSVVINEIAAYPSSTHEWIELLNTTESNIDLTGWKFWEGGVNHGLAAANFTLLPGAYALICQDAAICASDHPNFAGLILDSSWSTLNESGEEIGLKDASGIFVEQFTYITAPDHSLERQNPLLLDYSGANWREHVSGDTAGAANSATNNTNTENANTTTTTTITPTPPTANTASGSSAATSSTTSQTIILNEIFISALVPGAAEQFIELTNIGEVAIELTGWKLQSGTSTFALKGIIPPQTYLTFFEKTTTLRLPANNGEINLLDPSRNIANIHYPESKRGQSYSRDEHGIWKWTNRLTPTQKNIFEEPDQTEIIWKLTVPSELATGEIGTFSAAGSVDPRGGYFFPFWQFEDSASHDGFTVNHSFTTSGIFTVAITAVSTAGTHGSRSFAILVDKEKLHRPIIISEVVASLKNPNDSDAITLYNPTTSTINLAGWHLENIAGKKYDFPPNTIAAPGQHLTFYRVATNLAIIPTKDSVKLFSPDKIIDTFSININAIVPSKIEPTQTKAPAQILGTKIAATTPPLVVKNIRAFPKKTSAKIAGHVSALPETFGKHAFYVSNDDTGLLIIYKDNQLPPLSLGDAITAAGTISARGQFPALKLEILTKSLPTSFLAASTTIAELSEDMLGQFVRLTGEITERKKNYVYVDDGDGEIKVVFKAGTNLDGNTFAVGENVAVNGIVEQGKNELELWPRSADDFTKITSAPSRPVTSNKTLPITIGGGALVGSAFILRRYGATIIKIIKK